MASRTRLPSKVSGEIVEVSGQYVELQSGAFVSALVSGTVQVASGLPVQISGQHIYVESGVHVIPQSGQHVLISGQHVYVESGVSVVAQSGLGVLISGQHVFVESGVYLASGIGIVIQSGATVAVQSGVVIASGLAFRSGIGVQVQSGIGVLISGQHIYVESGVGVLVSGQSTAHHVETDDGDIALGSVHQSVISLLYAYDSLNLEWARLYVNAATKGLLVDIANATDLSGLGVLISGQHVYVESGVYLASGTGVIVQPLTSGEIHVMSGAVTIYLLSSEVKINSSGNPIVVGAISHGIALWSSAVISVTVKALSINSGDIYLGGHALGQGPYSGQGFLLEPGEAINIDVDNVGKVHVFAEVSGDRASYAGVTG